MRKKDVKIEKWHGMESYKCQYCKHSTLDLLEAEEHYQREHAPPPPPKPRPSQHLTDRFGNPLLVDEKPQPGASTKAKGE